MPARRFPRLIAPSLASAARHFSAIVLTGPRRAGKTFCLRTLFPKAEYHLLEDPDVIAGARSDPRGFIEDLRTPVILDEIQNVPDLLPYIRTKIDASPSKKGRWLITGSQDFSLMHGVSESMAGRAAIFHLLPLSQPELGRWDLLRGGYPEVWLHPRAAETWFRSYVQTYLERDVRMVTAVRDLPTFRRFMSLVASRNAQILNKTDIAGPLGVSVPTVAEWLGVLETTGVVFLVPPYFENFGKRIVKTPKVYFADTGLLCSLLGLGDRGALERSPFLGQVFETFVASEIVKRQLNNGRQRELYFFRDQQGLEVDFIVPDSGELRLVEAKWSRTVLPADARNIEALLKTTRRRTQGMVVHRGSTNSPADLRLTENVRGLTVERFLDAAGWDR
ncbi:MAG TPA: ATP-binding protein [Polyangiaceae bacterium]|nr:ATP-binding protein [Polyangiaceae bacterium]